VAGNPSGKRELFEELLKPGLILADVGIDVAVCTLEVRVAHDGLTAVSGDGDIYHVEIVFLDLPVQMHIDKVLSWRRPPVSQQHVFHVRERQRPLQQRVVVQINLTDRQIVGDAPIGIQLVEQFRSESVCLLFYFLLYFHGPSKIGRS
jgi:hypothetical protein